MAEREAEQQPSTQPQSEGPGADTLEQAAGQAMRNWQTRVLAGVPASVLVLLMLGYLPLVLLGLIITGLGVYGFYEFLRMAEGHREVGLPFTALQVGAGLIGLLAVGWGAPGLQGGLFLAVLVVLMATLFSDTDTSRSFDVAGLALLGLLCIPWLLNHVTLVLQAPLGRGLVIFLALSVGLSDTLAYVVGKFFGRTPLIPAISPHKTVEWAAGALAGGLLGAVVALFWLTGDDGFAPVSLLLLGLVLGGLAQCGDLLVSKFKRLNQVKDSGSFLPGHGGLLDRMDSYLLTTPFLYYIVVWL